MYITKSTFAKNNQMSMLPKILDKSKIRCVIYKPDIYNLQARPVSFPDQEKLLKQVDSG